MTSRRILVRDAMIAELNADPPSDIPDAQKGRWMPGLPLAGPRIGLYFGKEANVLPQQRHSRIAHRGLMIAVQCAVIVETAAEADDAIEPLLVHVVGQLADSTLGNLATSIEEVGVEWESVPADFIYAWATCFLQVNFQTARGDLTAKA